MSKAVRSPRRARRAPLRVAHPRPRSSGVVRISELSELTAEQAEEIYELCNPIIALGIASCDSDAATCVEISDDDVFDDIDAVPELPNVDRRILDLCVAGWGGYGRPLSQGLVRAGMTYADAVAAVNDAARRRLIVMREGCWTVVDTTYAARVPCAPERAGLASLSPSKGSRMATAVGANDLAVAFNTLATAHQVLTQTQTQITSLQGQITTLQAQATTQLAALQAAMNALATLAGTAIGQQAAGTNADLAAPDTSFKGGEAAP